MRRLALCEVVVLGRLVPARRVAVRVLLLRAFLAGHVAAAQWQRGKRGRSCMRSRTWPVDGLYPGGIDLPLMA